MIDFLKRLFKRKEQSRKWKTRYATWQSNPREELLHFWRSPIGVFEIYDDGDSFLLLHPKSLGLPAELFQSLEQAKERAAETALHYYL